MAAAHRAAGLTLQPTQAQDGQLRGVFAGCCHARPGIALDQADRQPANPVTAWQVHNGQGAKQEGPGLSPDSAPQLNLV
jgi:hypothetical protein